MAHIFLLIFDPRICSEICAGICDWYSGITEMLTWSDLKFHEIQGRTTQKTTWGHNSGVGVTFPISLREQQLWCLGGKSCVLRITHSWMIEGWCVFLRWCNIWLRGTAWPWFVKNHARDCYMITYALSLIRVSPWLPSSRIFSKNASCSVPVT